MTVLITASLFGLAAPAAPVRSAREAQAQLDRVESRIRAVTDAVQADVAQRDSLAAELRRADQALRAAHQRFEDARGRHVQSAARLADVRQESADLDARARAARDTLAAQLRALYVAGAGEPTPLPDPAGLADAQRMRAYATAVGRARSADLLALVARTKDLSALQTRVAVTTDRLADDATEREREAHALEQARQARARALTDLQARISNRSVQLKELKNNAAALEDLLKRLQAALAESAGDAGAGAAGRGAFGDLRGKLPWPVKGSVSARFGSPRVGGLTWNGLLIETRRGAEIHAPAAGRVVYSDWLPGLGLLVVLDHGGRWMTLYGYNGRLSRAVGDRVNAGDTIAVSAGVGDPGVPQLYFEVREATRAVDPGRFLRGVPSAP